MAYVDDGSDHELYDYEGRGGEEDVTEGAGWEDEPAYPEAEFEPSPEEVRRNGQSHASQGRRSTFLPVPKASLQPWRKTAAQWPQEPSPPSQASEAAHFWPDSFEPVPPSARELAQPSSGSKRKTPDNSSGIFGSTAPGELTSLLDAFAKKPKHEKANRQKSEQVQKAKQPKGGWVQKANKPKGDWAALAPGPQNKTGKKVAKVAVQPEFIDRQATYKGGDLVIAYSKKDGYWSNATVIGLKDGINFRIEYAHSKREETTSFLQLRHKPGSTNSKRHNLVAPDDRVIELRHMLPYALHGLRSREDMLATWRTYRVLGGAALGPEDSAFLEGCAACIANSYDVCRKIIRDAGGSIALPTLAELHSGTFGGNAAKYLGQPFKEFVTAHFTLDGSTVRDPELTAQKQAAVKRGKRSVGSADSMLRNAITSCCRANKAEWTTVTELARDKGVLAALRAVPEDEWPQRIFALAKKNCALRATKDGKAIRLARGT
eukprot:TRINITY_DN8122_c0_g1_i1.p1 TRINITY_DN8122_c0_g1~~TRINITY_DN8122_c0_g1_i1.p1  ORF type:complete len:489 (-),score=50.07 TRINITY_DN8122_c0_g1_i1:19-1485(-)